MNDVAQAITNLAKERTSMIEMLKRVSHLNSFRELNDLLPEIRELLKKVEPRKT